MISIILLAVFNGFIIAWKQNIGAKELRISKMWHLLGRIMIVFIFVDILLKDFYLSIGWVLLLCIFNLSWTVWNFTINLTRRLLGTDISIFHIGDGGFDGWLKSKLPVYAIWLIGFLLIAINLIFIF